jgi:predicted ATP-grasp superfamily ATP-dependent carboligase
VVLDAFADLDTREAATAAERVPVDGDWRFDAGRLLDAARRLAPPPVPLAYGSGFERNADLLLALARGRELLGSLPAAVLRAKDPEALACLLRGLGVPHPEVSGGPPADPEGWLAKRVGGAGGAHVRPAADARAAEAGRYFQRVAPGRAVSALVAGDGAAAVVLAFSEQWSDPAPGRPFRYGGAATPAELPPALAAALGEAAARVAAAGGLRGLGSVDALVDGDGFSVLELNLRPGAAFDAYERACGVGLFALHVAACRDGLDGLEPLRPLRAAASAVVWAPERLVVPEGFRWPGWSADRGAAGTVAPSGGPVCTVLGEGLSAAEAREVAGTRALTLLSRLQRHAQRAG